MSNMGIFKRQEKVLFEPEEVKAIVEARHGVPHKVLGAHQTSGGILVSAFIPNAKKMRVRNAKSGTYEDMIESEYKGFFYYLYAGKRKLSYKLEATFDNDSVMEYVDPYSFEPYLDATDLKRFEAGIHYEIYEKLGAHPLERDGVKGVLFAVWAPNAERVSVVGDFNLWDGRRHAMSKLGDSGIFELFIPGLATGEIYKYEVRTKQGYCQLKSDPYGNEMELRPNNASVVTDLSEFTWEDEEWLARRKEKDQKSQPISIYEIHLGSFMKPTDGREFYNYREIAPLLCDYLKEMEYTHVELLPIMEHPFDPSWGYQVTGYYAPTKRYGTPQDFMYFINYLHKEGFGVILDWVPAHFPKDGNGLANFDGTCLYEHQDKRQGEHPHWGTLIYNYGRKEVSNFLIANALFWSEVYHVDGIRVDAVASMLYLDYGRNDGEWIPNMYGGNENLEAVEFLKHLNSVFKGKKNGAMMIAEDSTAWPRLTHDLNEDGVGFDFKWNMGWMNDFLGYMRQDPIYRKYHHGELTFSMVYAYSENFILVLSHDEVVHGKGSLINKMPGTQKQKFANLRAVYGFMMTHPGKKLLFMGQEFGQYDEWNESESIQWNLLKYPVHDGMKHYYKALNHLYQTEPALYELDTKPEGFEWINNISADESILVFLRKTERKEDTLLVVCNFTPVVYEDYKIGVPFKGKYKEIFSSDKEEFGGENHLNTVLKQSKKDECDERPNSITITVPPMGISIFKYQV